MKKAEKDGKQKLSFHFVPTQHVKKNSKNIEKKFQKFKNTIVASFQAIIGWNRPRNRENREKDKIQISVSFRSYPMRNRKFQTNSKKIQKIVKYYYGFISSQNKGGNAEIGRK